MDADHQIVALLLRSAQQVEMSDMKKVERAAEIAHDGLRPALTLPPAAL
jgi:hypothetical protein